MDEIHELQARAEGVEIVGGGDKVTFLGEQFRIAAKIGRMPLLKFAASCQTGAETDDLEGHAAMYALIRDVIDPADWPRFERHAIDEKADDDDLFKVVTDVIQLLAARPTRRPVDSSTGPRPTSDCSKAISSSPAPGPVAAPEVRGEMSELVTIDELITRREARLTA